MTAATSIPPRASATPTPAKPSSTHGGPAPRSRGAGWDDDLQGNEGDDKVIGGGGVDVVRGGEDNDIVCAFDGEVRGGGGDDELYLVTFTGSPLYVGGTGTNGCYHPSIAGPVPGMSTGCPVDPLNPPQQITAVGTCPL